MGTGFFVIKDKNLRVDQDQKLTTEFEMTFENFSPNEFEPLKPELEKIVEEALPFNNTEVTLSLYNDFGDIIVTIVTKLESETAQIQTLTYSQDFPQRIYIAISRLNELNDAEISLESITIIESRRKIAF